MQLFDEVLYTSVLLNIEENQLNEIRIEDEKRATEEKLDSDTVLDVLDVERK